MERTLLYYHPTREFVLLEIEVLGQTINRRDKSVTDKFKVLRVVPKEEYTEDMNSRLARYQYDERGNITVQPRFNMFTDEITSVTYEYDDRNNKIRKKLPDGRIYTYGYDEKNRRISESYPHPLNIEYIFEYDDNDNIISQTEKKHDVQTYNMKYDDNGNCIEMTPPAGEPVYYKPATITEE
jgi:YD repeat-containing protein